MKRSKPENSINYDQSQSFINYGRDLNELLGDEMESVSNSLGTKTIKEDGVISQEEADEIYKRLKNEAESRANHGM